MTLQTTAYELFQKFQLWVLDLLVLKPKQPQKFSQICPSAPWGPWRDVDFAIFTNKTVIFAQIQLKFSFEKMQENEGLLVKMAKSTSRHGPLGALGQIWENFLGCLVGWALFYECWSSRSIAIPQL